MKKTKRSRQKRIGYNDIEHFCRGVEDVLAKINERCAPKENNRKNKKEEALTHSR